MKSRAQLHITMQALDTPSWRMLAGQALAQRIDSEGLEQPQLFLINDSTFFYCWCQSPYLLLASKWLQDILEDERSANPLQMFLTRSGLLSVADAASSVLQRIRGHYDVPALQEVLPLLSELVTAEIYMIQESCMQNEAAILHAGYGWAMQEYHYRILLLLAARGGKARVVHDASGKITTTGLLGTARLLNVRRELKGITLQFLIEGLGSIATASLGQGETTHLRSSGIAFDARDVGSFKFTRFWT